MDGSATFVDPATGHQVKIPDFWVRNAKIGMSTVMHGTDMADPWAEYPITDKAEVAESAPKLKQVAA